jgi:hypothetical protein
MSDTQKAANMRRYLGIGLFAALVGLGIAAIQTGGLVSLMGVGGLLMIFFGGLALAAWGAITGHPDQTAGPQV